MKKEIPFLVRFAERPKPAELVWMQYDPHLRVNSLSDGDTGIPGVRSMGTLITDSNEARDQSEGHAGGTYASVSLGKTVTATAEAKDATDEQTVGMRPVLSAMGTTTTRTAEGRDDSEGNPSVEPTPVQPG